MTMCDVFMSARVARIDELTVSDSGGKALFRLNFSVAFDVFEKGNKKANFINCTAFGRNAENFANIMNKGDQVVVAGSLQIDSWEKNGEKRTSPKVIVNRFDKMWPPKQQEGISPEQQGGASPVSGGLQESNFDFNG